MQWDPAIEDPPGVVGSRTTDPTLDPLDLWRAGVGLPRRRREKMPGRQGW